MDDRKKRSDALTHGFEQKIIGFFIPRYPSWVTPDLLTFSALLSAVFAAVSYAISTFNPIFLWLASFFIFLHWLFDSTDGGLAIYRKKPRPNYGHYVDHILDAVSMLFIGVGLALGNIIDWELAFLIIALYYGWMLHSALMHSIKGVYKISYFNLGPTEGRIGLIIANAILFFFPYAKYLNQHIVNIAFTFFLVIGTLALAGKIIESILVLRKEDESKLKNQR